MRPWTHMVRLGLANGAAKLTPAAVLKIRAALGQQSIRSLATAHGVSRTAIYHVKSGRNWGYVGLPGGQIS